MSNDFINLRHRLDQFEYTEYLDPVDEREYDFTGAAESDKENNVLHKDIIALQESKDSFKQESLQTTRRLEQKIHEMKFIQTQYQTKYQMEQARNDELQNKLQELLYKSQYSTPQETGKKLVSKLPKIDLETGLVPLSEMEFYKPPDPVVYDIVNNLESKVETLTSQVQLKDSTISDLTNKCSLLKDQLEKREFEITRLGSELQLARADQFVAKQHITRPTESRNGNISRSSMRNIGISDLETAKDRIEQLEIQTEYLQEHINGLEKEVEDLENTKSMVQSSFVEEKRELAQKLAQERERNAKLMENLENVEKMVNQLNPNTIQVSKNPSNIKNAKTISELNDKLKAANLKSEQSSKRILMLQKDINKLTKENKLLTEKLNSKPNEITNAESKVNAESKINVESKIELESARKEIAHLRSILQEQEKVSVPNRENEHLQRQLKALYQENSIQKSTLETLTFKIDTSDRILQDVKIENTCLVRQYETCKKERDDMIAALESFEGELAELCDQITQITQERDNLLELYKQVNEQLESKQNQKSLAPDVKPETQDTSNVEVYKIEISKLKETEKILLETIDSQTMDIKKLKDDLQAMSLRTRETGVYANEAVSQLEREISREKHEMAIKSLRELEQNYQDQLKQNAADQQTIANMELTRESDLLKIRELKSKINESNLQVTKYEAELKNMAKIIEEKDKYIGENKHLLTQIDKERDGFQNQLDQSLENLADLREKYDSVQTNYKELLKERESHLGQIETLTKHLNQQDVHVNELQGKLDELVILKNRLESQLNQFKNENNQLSSDLMAITRENQILNSELSMASQTRDQYQAELRDCDIQIQQLNKLILGKDTEHQQLILSYHKVISEHEKLELVLRSSTEEMNNLKMEIVMRDKRIHQLQEHLDKLSQEVTKYKLDNSAHEKQESNLTRTLATAERNIKQLEIDKLRLQKEVDVCRELTQSINRSKEDVNQRFIACNVENEKLENLLYKNSVEFDSLKTQLQAQILKCERLEELLNSERTRKMKSEQSSKDLQASQGNLEIQLQKLNEQQALNLKLVNKQLEEAKLESENLQARVASMEKVLHETQTQLTESNKQLQEKVQKMQELEQKLKEKEDTIQDLLQLFTKDANTEEPGSDALKLRIINQIQELRKEREKNNREISEKLSPKSGISSVASDYSNSSKDSAADVYLERLKQESIEKEKRVLATIASATNEL
ncbi:hypothetical protein HK103_004133 [Boothiomyces macroporosus]|uniref:Uncharacterized protein n=1 Tax=Boothiomyces macroporosus TaxID=261099 RepID=A0AAD5UJM7_9FUNG|nr:hypothetical protein HK103_004133 [Boothiomyces macroporosus]